MSLFKETNDGSNLNDRLLRIEAKNQKQENEISFLKAVVVEDKNVIRQLTGRISRLESILMANQSSASREKLLTRPKRPFRLVKVDKI